MYNRVNLSVNELDGTRPAARQVRCRQFRFSEFGAILRPDRHNFAVHPSAIKRITSMVDDKEGQAPDVSLIKIDVQLKEKTPVGKHTYFLISPDDLLVLVKYLHAVNGTPHAP